jgi:pimeloyl-ACP methyl ester carboxylesterase
MATLRRISFGLIGLVIAAVLAGTSYQAVMEARDDRRFPPPGKLIDVDGHRMHLHCQGHGSPTVIVEQGVGAQSLGWAPLNEQLSSITTVCAYDRPGMGYSDPIDHPTSAAEIAVNLQKLLRNAGVTEDIVLVGWSVGGMYAREYYRQFPEHVKGMVLVDSSHEQQLQRLGDPDVGYENPFESERWLAPIGWTRLTGEVPERFAESPLPVPIRDRLVAINLKSHLPGTMVREGKGMRVDLEANRAPPTLGDIPLIVISEGKPNIPFMQERIETWYALQDELARLSARGKHIVATQSAHAIHRTEPELIVESVRQVVHAARESRAQ